MITDSVRCGYQLIELNWIKITFTYLHRIRWLIQSKWANVLNAWLLTKQQVNKSKLHQRKVCIEITNTCERAIAVVGMAHSESEFRFIPNIIGSYQISEQHKKPNIRNLSCNFSSNIFKIGMLDDLKWDTNDGDLRRYETKKVEKNHYLRISIAKWNSAILNYPLWAILQGLTLNSSRPFELNIVLCNRWRFYYFYIGIDDKPWSFLKHTISIKLLPIVKLHDNTFAISEIVKPNLFSFFSVYLRWEYSRKIKGKEADGKRCWKQKLYMQSSERSKSL